MKRLGLVIIALTVILGGCGLFHEHEWKDATCTTPKVCATCEEVKGEALGHDYAPANYQQPATCRRCDVVDGTVLQPDFEIHGLTVDTEVDQVYVYHTCGNGDPETEVVGELKFYDYKIFEGDDKHTAKEGYEWRSVKAELLFKDEAVLRHGAEWSTTWEDYYTIAKHDSSTNAINETTYQFALNYMGVDYADALFTKELTHSGWEGNHYLVTYEFYFRVPIGYDGCVVGFYHGATEWGSTDYIYDVADENTIFFRLK